MGRFVICILTALLFSSSPVRADTLTLSRQVLLPDGKPAVGAKVFVQTFARFNFPKVKDQSVEATTDRDGRYEITIDNQPGMAGYILIDASGAALHLNLIGLWMPAKSDNGFDPLKLSPEYFVEGRALDQKGEPIAGATVALSWLYAESYSPFPLSHEDTKNLPPDLEAKTDGDGKYQMRGMDGFESAYDWSKEVEVFATGDRNGVHYLGSGQIKFDPNAKTAQAPNLIIMHAVGDINARVVDGVTGKPISGVIAQLSTNDMWTPLSSQVVRTDDTGTFEAKGMPAESTIEIGKDGYPRTDVSFPAKEATGAILPPTPRSVTIVLNPLVPLSARIVDAETGDAPLVPSVLSVMQTQNLEGGTTEWSFGSQLGGLVGIEKWSGSFFPGVFSPKEEVLYFEAPVGHDKLQFEYPAGFSSNPYEQSQDFDAPAGGAKDVTITLHRQPGILFKLDIDDPERVDIMSPKNDIEIDLTRSGNPNMTYAGYLATEWFFPVDKWGETVTIRILERHKDGSKTDLVPSETIVTDPKIWPVTIKVPPAP